MFSLTGQKALVVGIANADSIAYGCAQAFRAQGAELALTYLDEKTKAHTQALAEALGAEIFAPLDVGQPEQFEALFAQISRKWGRLDTVLHSVAFSPKQDLHGRVTDCSRCGFAAAMDVSVGSFIDLVRRAEPLMGQGGACMTVSFYGAEKVVSGYNIMGPVKAALESAVRYMAAELGPKGIRVHALSPGPMKTRAASGIADFDQMMQEARLRAPTHQLASLADCGAFAAFLASREAANITGGLHYIDGGFNITG